MEHDKIVGALYREIEKRDRLISKLKEENEILMRTAIKAKTSEKELLDRVNVTS